MNTNFQLQSFAFNPALAKLQQKAPANQTNTVQNQTEVKSTPSESVTFSTPLKVAREGSDMAQMVEDLQNNGVMPQPKAETVSPQAEEKKQLREPRDDFMAQMVESIKNDGAAGGSSVHVQVNDNGTIALLDDSAFFTMPGLDSKQSAQEFKSQNPDHKHASEHEGFGVSTQDHGHGTAHGHGHGSGFKEDGLLGGHMGTEVIEKIGHSAHHVSHAASEGGTHIAAEAGAHGTAKIAAEGASHGAAKMGAHGTELMAHGAETTSETVDATAAGLKHVTENAHHLSTGLEVALGIGTVGAGILAVPLTVNGIKELNHGIKEKDTDKILEGVGGIAVGTRSAATAAVMGGMLTTSEVVGQIAGVASATLTPLGLVHAGVDTVLGVRDIKKGKTTEGLLKIGTGVAIGAAAVVGGLPLTVAALGMLGVKVGHKIYSKSQEKKKAAAAEEAAKQQPQTPQSLQTGELNNSQVVTPQQQVHTQSVGVKT